ncbi:TniB family NTP-binding protein [Massilia sp. B-10]|nr:TniB family NTP-binding protein [Massilia sp. B-10]UUZ52263.1 TniB family NTP-binding protein [Massilia sp. H-1]
MKSIGREIRMSIKDMCFEHPTFVEVKEPVVQRIHDTMDGLKPCFLMVLGTSRCGKTEVMKAIASQFESERIGGRKSIPFLVVNVRTGSGVQALDEAVIAALGVRTKIRGESAIRTFMHEQLALANVRVIWFDEASHLVERGANITPEKAADWFKELYDNKLQIGIVLSGIPSLKRLLKDNPQLANRTTKPVYFLPYRYDDPDHRQAFADSVALFQSLFEERGCTFSIDQNTMVRHCYAISAGQIGVLSDFFDELARLITAPTKITFELCEQASSSKNLPCPDYIKPFCQEKIEDHQLMEILCSELGKHKLSLPILEHRTVEEEPSAAPELKDLYDSIGKAHQ